MHSASSASPRSSISRLLQSRRQTLAAVALLAAIFVNLTPIWLVQYPPLQDYANHLARVYLIGNLSESAAPLQPYYSFHWLPYPNLFIDVVGPVLNLVFPIYVTGKILLSLYVIVWPLAIVFFWSSVSVAPRWPAWLLGLLTTYNYFFIAGFLNFCFGMALCLFTFGLWLRWRDALSLPRILLLAVMMEFTFLTHIYAFICLAMAFAAYEFAGFLRRGGLTFDARVFTPDFKKLLIGGALFVPPVITAIPWLRVAEKGSPPDLLAWPLHWIDKGTMAFAPLRSVLDRKLGIGSYLDIILLAMLVIFVVASLRRPWFRNPRLLAPLAAFTAFFWFHNEGALEGVNSDTRLILLIYAMAFAALNLQPRRAPLWLAAFALIFSARVAMLAAEWRASDVQLQAYAQSFDRMSAGARVCPAVVLHRSLPMRISPELHFPSYALIDRGAVLANIFAKPFQQPLRLEDSLYRTYQATFRRDRVNWSALAAQCDLLWTYDVPTTEAEANFGPRVFSSGKVNMYQRGAFAAAHSRDARAAIPVRATTPDSP